MPTSHLTESSPPPELTLRATSKYWIETATEKSHYKTLKTFVPNTSQLRYENNDILIISSFLTSKKQTPTQYHRSHNKKITPIQLDHYQLQQQLMSIARPSQKEVTRFYVTQLGKNHTGDWTGPINYYLFAGYVGFGLFFHSVYKSMTPSGIVPRILYQKSLSLPHRHFRHLLPAVILVGSLFAFDVHSGLWSDEK